MRETARSSADVSNAGRAAFLVLRAEERPAWHGIINAGCAYAAVVVAFASSFVGRRTAAGLSPARRVPHDVRRPERLVAQARRRPRRRGKTGTPPPRRNRGVSLSALHRGRAALVCRAVPRAVLLPGWVWRKGKSTCICPGYSRKRRAVRCSPSAGRAAGATSSPT